MNRLITSLAVSGLLLAGAQAFAQSAQDNGSSSTGNMNSSNGTSSSNGNMSSTNGTSSSSSSGMTMAQKRQAMKDCVARETSANNGMSKSDARKACKDQVKAQSDQSSTTGR